MNKKITLQEFNEMQQTLFGNVVNKKITIQEFYEMQQTLFGNVVIHPSVPDDLVPCAKFVWDADLKEMVFDGFANFDGGRRNAEK